MPSTYIVGMFLQPRKNIRVCGTAYLAQAMAGPSQGFCSDLGYITLPAVLLYASKIAAKILQNAAVFRSAST